MNISSHQNIALFGGTFDPVHTGHIAVARYVLAQCDLSSVLFVPAPHPPHKQKTHAAFHQRVEMLELAIMGYENMGISLIEDEHSGPSYTLKTVIALKQRHNNTTFFLLIGADSLIDIPLWYQSEELLRMVNFIVVGREDQVERGKIKEAISRLNISFVYDDNNRVYRSGNNTTITLLESFKWPGSSSEIRKILHKGMRPENLSDEVFSYIKKNNLYRLEM